MKTYRILKSFKGSQNGLDSHDFVAGTEAKLSDSLAAAVAGTGWVELVEAPMTLGVSTPASTIEERETKVEAPAETKVEAPEEVKAEEPAGKKPGKKKR